MKHGTQKMNNFPVLNRGCDDIVSDRKTKKAQLKSGTCYSKKSETYSIRDVCLG